MAGTIVYANQIHSGANMKNAVRCFDNSGGRNQVSQVTFKLTSNTADTTLAEYISPTQTTSIIPTEALLLGIVGLGTPKNAHQVNTQSEGDIMIESILLTSTSAVTSQDDDWEIVSLLNTSTWGAARWTSGTTVAITHATESGGTAASKTYDLHRLSGDIEMNALIAPSSTNAITRPGIVLRSGDCLALTAQAADFDSVVNLVADIFVSVRYRRLTPGAKFTGMGTITG